LLKTVLVVDTFATSTFEITPNSSLRANDVIGGLILTAGSTGVTPAAQSEALPAQSLIRMTHVNTDKFVMRKCYAKVRQ
jgi:hypothetical protein